MNQAIDVTPDQRKTLLSLLANHLPNTEAWVYGSRVRWTSRPESDLDMAVFATPSQEGDVSGLRDALEASDLPFRVDLLVWDEIPEIFREQIQKEHVVLVGLPIRASAWTKGPLGKYIVMNDATYSPREAWPVVNYLDTGSITENRIRAIQRLNLNDEKLPSRARRKVEMGDIVFSTVRPNKRHFGLIREVPENFLASTGFAVFHGREDIADTGFIYWFLAQDGIVDRLHTIAEHSTSAYPSIRRADIESLEIDLPPLPEQRAIAHILGTLDDKIELNRRMSETLEAVARAIFKDWFVDFGPVRAKMGGQAPYLPPEIWKLFPDTLDGDGKPTTWALDTLARLAVTNRESWTARHHPSALEYVDLSNTKWGNIDTSTFLDWENAPSRARRVTRAGDTVVGTTRPGNGSFAYISRDGLTVSTGFAVLSPHTAEYRDFVYLAVTCTENVERLANLADGHGGAYPAVKPSEVSETAIVFPGDKVLASFAELVSPIRERIEHSKSESGILTRSRDALLPKLISGEIRIRDAEKAVEAIV